MQKLIYILLISTILPFQRGNIVSVDLIESETQNQIQLELNSVGQFGVTAFYGAKIYKVLYETLDGYGDSTVASGVIAIPDSENEAFGILSWQHGTEINRNNVLSNSGFDLLSRIVAASGYVFVASDYLGLGVSEDIHPYILKEPTASAVIDMVRATRHFFDENSEYQLNRQLSLFGYSEGGYATLASQMVMEENFADEFEIMVSFPMAGPYDLSTTMLNKMLDGQIYGQPFYLPFNVYSYIHYYDLGDVSEYIIPEFAIEIPELFSGNYGGGHINDYMNSNNYNPPISSMLPEIVEEFENNEDYFFRQLLAENDLYDWTPQSLTYLFHGISDHLVPYENSVIAYDKFIENGATNVHLELLPEIYGNHQEAAPYAILGAFNIIENLKHINPLGDITHDENIDVTDVLSCVNIILNPQDYDDVYMQWAGDLDQNSMINVIDVLTLVNNILGS
jgi:hypothetical protein